jgi:putative transposase
MFDSGEVQLRYKYRIEPTPGQRIALARAFGCARVVFNDGLRVREQAYYAGLPYLSDTKVMRQVITEAKKTDERAWLAEVSAVVLQQAVTDLNTAYRNFFASVTGKRKGRKVARPRFRSRKDHRQSIRFTRNARFRIVVGGKLRLAKIGDVKVCWSRELPGEPSSVTVIQDAAGRYFASFVVDTRPDILPEVATDTGIDLGLTCFATFPDGRTIEAPRFLRRAERKLKRAQQNLSRKQNGGKNRARARIAVARRHARVADTRRDWHHKESTKIIRDNQAVYVGRPRGVGPGTRTAGQVRARRRMVGVREHAGVQGDQTRTAVPADRPVRAHHPHLLRVWLVRPEARSVCTDIPL